ncbi:MAG: 2-phosphosulfolactate phosphatase [Hymenobacter sp.]
MAVIVDVLRATSTIATALHQGMTAVYPVATVAECVALGRERGCLTAAERDGVRAAGVDLGNSPFELLHEDYPVRGRELAISTTNGTRALRHSLAAEALVCGAFINLTAVADFCRAQQRDILVVAAGWKGKFASKTPCWAGPWPSACCPTASTSAQSDAALTAYQLWQNARADLPSYLHAVGRPAPPARAGSQRRLPLLHPSRRLPRRATSVGW